MGSIVNEVEIVLDSLDIDVDKILAAVTSLFVRLIIRATCLPLQLQCGIAVSVIHAGAEFP